MDSLHIDVLKEHVTEIFEQFGVRKIGIFGSVVRGEDTPVSDIDILVEFSPGKRHSTTILG